MLRIKRGEESELTSWYFETDLKMMVLIFLLVFVSMVMMICAGSAEATRLSHPWFYFIQKAMPFYIVGIVGLFACSMMKKKWILWIAWAFLGIGMIGLGITLVKHGMLNGSNRWATIAGIRFMPADILKIPLVILTAWFMQKMQSIYGKDAFVKKEAWGFHKYSWLPALLIIGVCCGVMFKHPDVGTALLFVGVVLLMAFVAGLPMKIFLLSGGIGIGVIGVLAVTIMPHIKARIAQIFDVLPRTQVWYSLNAIRHGGLLGRGDKAYVQDVLPEATNDFIYSSIAETWGALAGIGLICILFMIIQKLIKYAVHAKDKFVVYVLTGTVALFGGQICFNMATALHIVINKGMTLPFVSYGGGSFVCFSILFGMVLALVREDTWDNR